MTKSTLNTSKIAVGTWAWGDSGQAGNGYFGSATSKASLQEVVDRGISSGLTTWDTAAVYGMGHSETVLGQMLASHDRSEYQLSTKFTPQAADSSESPVADMLNDSLKRLGTDYIDLYWIHNPADVAKWTPQLIPLLQSGKIKHVGVSNHSVAQIKQANDILQTAGYRVEAVQNHYSLLYRKSEEAGILDYCKQNDIQFFAYMVLEQGALSGKYTPDNPMPAGSTRARIYNPILPQLVPLTTELATIGKDQGATAAEVATAWAIAKGTTPIIGVTKPAYIDSEVRALNVHLSAEQVQKLEQLAAAAQVNTRGGWEGQA